MTDDKFAADNELRKETLEQVAQILAQRAGSRCFQPLHDEDGAAREEFREQAVQLMAPPAQRFAVVTDDEGHSYMVRPTGSTPTSAPAARSSTFCSRE